jgi:type II secretory pathway pseudopilin PulG
MTSAARALPPMVGDRGFGMSEIVISMFMLALLALALLPLLISSAQLSSKNVTLTTATQLVNEQMDVVRGLAPTCSTLTTFSGETVGLHTTDPRGTVLAVERTTNSCPSTYPGLMTFTAQVRADGSAQVLAEATTRIFVTSATGPAAP